MGKKSPAWCPHKPCPLPWAGGIRVYLHGQFEMQNKTTTVIKRAFPGGSAVKNLLANARESRFDP